MRPGELVWVMLRMILAICQTEDLIYLAAVFTVIQIQKFWVHSVVLLQSMAKRRGLFRINTLPIDQFHTGYWAMIITIVVEAVYKGLTGWQIRHVLTASS